MSNHADYKVDELIRLYDDVQQLARQLAGAEKDEREASHSTNSKKMVEAKQEVARLERLAVDLVRAQLKPGALRG